MTDAYLAVFGSLIGVLLGVMGTLFTTSMQQRAEDQRAGSRLKEDRRKEYAGLIAAFSACEMKLWDISRDLSFMARDHTLGRVDLETAPWKTRLGEQLGTSAAVSAELVERLAMLRILVPELAQAASDLMHAVWDSHGDDKWVNYEASHDHARATFEAKARVLLNG